MVSVVVAIVLVGLPVAALLLADILLGQIFWQTIRRPMARRERRLDSPTYPDSSGPSLL